MNTLREKKALDDNLRADAGNALDDFKERLRSQRKDSEDRKEEKRAEEEAAEEKAAAETEQSTLARIHS